MEKTQKGGKTFCEEEEQRVMRVLIFTKKIGTSEIALVSMEKTQKGGKTFCEEEEQRVMRVLIFTKKSERAK